MLELPHEKVHPSGCIVRFSEEENVISWGRGRILPFSKIFLSKVRAYLYLNAMFLGETPKLTTMSSAVPLEMATIRDARL
jgi:hypothetical protein